MIVTLRAPGTREGSWEVELAVVPREGETVTVGETDDDVGQMWTVRQVVHYPVQPGQSPRPPYVVIHRERAFS